MKKLQLLFSSLLLCLHIFSQTEDCFRRASRQQKEDMKSFPKVKVGDTISDDFIKKGDRRLQSLIGCQFPDTTFTTIDGKEMNTGKIQSDFVIVYMSMFYCDMCNATLQEIAKLKKEYGKKLTILAIMEDGYSDFKQLIKDYKDKIVFVPNTRDWIYAHNAGCGVPITFLLDKSKLIKFVKSGAPPNNSPLISELKKRMN